VDRAKRIAYSGMVAALVIVSLYIGLIIRARVTFLALATFMLAIPVIRFKYLNWCLGRFLQRIYLHFC